MLVTKCVSVFGKDNIVTLVNSNCRIVSVTVVIKAVKVLLDFLAIARVVNGGRFLIVCIHKKFGMYKQLLYIVNKNVEKQRA